MKLYDMDKQEWRELKPTLHQHWRSTKIFKCAICHVKTNDWVLGGAYWGVGPKLICPGDSYKQHDELERLYKEFVQIDTKIKDYKKVEKPAKNIQVMIRMRLAEKDALSIRIKVLREKFKKLHDVAGNPKRTEYYYPCARIGSEKERLT